MTIGLFEDKTDDYECNMLTIGLMGWTIACLKKEKET